MWRIHWHLVIVPEDTWGRTVMVGVRTYTKSNVKSNEFNIQSSLQGQFLDPVSESRSC